MMRCPRCTWVSNDDPAAGTARAQLEEHVGEKQHPRCVSCNRILLIDEAQTCGDWPGSRRPDETTCVDRGHELVSGIVTSWADLHGEQRMWPRTAMLSGGGSGDMPRRLNRLERAATERWWLLDRMGPLPRLEWKRLEAARAGKEHLIDNLAGDPPDIRYELERWEDDWRHERGEAAAVVSMQLESIEWWVKDAVGPLVQAQWRPKIRRGGASASVRGAAEYLERQMRWAARTHPAFADFLLEMTKLHGRCVAAVGRAPVKPEQLDVECLDCRTLLQHPLIEVDEEKDGHRWTGPAIDKRARVCPGCGSRYDDVDDRPGDRWKMAQAETASRRASVTVDGEVWQQVTRIAHDLGRSRQTVYAWVRTGELRSFEQKGLVFVPVDDATAMHRDRPVRMKRVS